MNFNMNNSSNFKDLVVHVIGILELIIPLIIVATFLYIIWKVIDSWIINGAEDIKIKEGKETLVFGIIALVVMTGIWGILAILRNSLF